MPHDNGTYLVRSRSRDGHHIVEVEVRCSCEGFEHYKSCWHSREFRRRHKLLHPRRKMWKPIVDDTRE